MYFCARFLKTDMAQFTEEDKIMRRVEQRFNKGMVKYRLIEDGDKILVGFPEVKNTWRYLKCWQSVIVYLNHLFRLLQYKMARTIFLISPIWNT